MFYLIFYTDSGSIKSDNSDLFNDLFNDLFREILEDFEVNRDIKSFDKFCNVVCDYEVEYICNQCNSHFYVDYFLSVQDKFYMFLDRYIYKSINNIIKGSTDLSLNDFEIDLHNKVLFSIFLKQFPEEYKSIIDFTLDVFDLKEILPTIGGCGAGIEELDWIYQQLTAEFLGICIGLFITFGKKAVNRINKINIKRQIKNKIKNEDHDWNDFNIDDLIKYVEIPKDFNNSKEELIEEIINCKMKEYKAQLIAKFKSK